MPQRNDNLCLFPFPMRGVHAGWAQFNQPKGTCPSSSNVVPQDRGGRLRGAQRPGLAKQYTDSTGNPIQCMVQVTWVDTGGTRHNDVLVVSNGEVYQNTLAPGTQLPRTGTALGTGTVLAAAGTAGRVYFAGGGQHIKALDLSEVTPTLRDLAATKGAAPQYCTGCTIWRDRLVCWGPRHVWYMSRIGTYTDFDYAASDPARAVAGQNSSSVVPGAVSDVIVSMIPASEDTLLCFGDERCWAFRGDPADGGDIVLVESARSICGPKAWCRGQGRDLWIASTTGLLRWDGGILQPVETEAQSSWFASVNRSTARVSLALDVYNELVWIFAPKYDGSTGTAMAFDLRQHGFWPQSFPYTMLPQSVLVYDGDSATDRKLWLGGYDGYVRRMADGAYADDGTAISSSIYLPGSLVPELDWTHSLRQLHAVAGELPDGVADSVFNCAWTVQAGLDARTAWAAPDSTATGTWTAPGRQTPLNLRVRGAAFFLKLENSTLNKCWTYELAQCSAVPAGRNR